MRRHIAQRECQRLTGSERRRLSMGLKRSTQDSNETKSGSGTYTNGHNFLSSPYLTTRPMPDMFPKHHRSAGTRTEPVDSDLLYPLDTAKSSDVALPPRTASHQESVTRSSMSRPPATDTGGGRAMSVVGGCCTCREATETAATELRP